MEVLITVNDSPLSATQKSNQKAKERENRKFGSSPKSELALISILFPFLEMKGKKDDCN